MTRTAFPILAAAALASAPAKTFAEERGPIQDNSFLVGEPISRRAR